MKYLKLLTVAGCCMLAACSTIVFDNGPQQQTASPPQKMGHHIGGIFALFEFSEPKNLKSLCNGNDWSSIKTEQTFVDGLIQQVVPWGIYAPRTTYTQCRTTPATFTAAVAPMEASSGITPSAPSSPRKASSSVQHYEREDNDEPSSAKDNLVGCNEKYKHLFFGCDD